MCIRDRCLAAPHHFDSNHTRSSRYSTVSQGTLGSLDINSEYSSPSYGDESYFDQMYTGRRSSTRMINPAPHSPSSPNDLTTNQFRPHKLLLHVAIGIGDIEMVKLLLEKGADVSLSYAYD